MVAPPLGADAAAAAAAALHGLAGAPGGAAGGAPSADALVAPGAPPAGGAAPIPAPASGGGVGDLSGISSERLRDGRLQYRVDVYAPREEGGIKRKRKYVGKYPTLEAAAAARDNARAELRAQGIAVSEGSRDDAPRYYGVTRLAARRVAAGAAPPPVQRWQAAAPRGAGEKPQYVGCFFSAELAARAVDMRRREWGATGGFNFPAPGESGYARATRRTPDALQAVPFRSHKSGKKKAKTDEDDAAAAGDDAEAEAGDAPEHAQAVEVEGVAAGEPAGPGASEDAADGGATWNALLAA